MVRRNVSDEPRGENEKEVADTTDLVAMLSKQFAQWFVRYQNQFHMVEKLSTHLTRTDVKRVCTPLSETV